MNVGDASQICQWLLKLNGYNIVAFFHKFYNVNLGNNEITLSKNSKSKEWIIFLKIQKNTSAKGVKYHLGGSLASISLHVKLSGSISHRVRIVLKILGENLALN